MALRSNWKGYLKLSLVSCAVALYPATSTSQRVRFNILNRETGHRIKNLRVDAETGEPVPEEDQVRGYKQGNRYVLVEDDELDNVVLESTHTIEIEEFIPRDEVDEIYLDESYYLLPEDKVAYEAFAVIREAMRTEDVVGLARVVMYRRERLLMLSPRDKVIMATVLRYNAEVRKEKDYVGDLPSIKMTPDMLDLAAHIVHTRTGHFDPRKFEDRYEDALRDLIKAKRAGKAIPGAPEPKTGNVINLMDALRSSVKAERGHGGRARRLPGRRARKSHSRAAGRRRMRKAS
jgi:DNA end-binding protein Ku